MPVEKKYVFINGVMKLNPNYQGGTAKTKPNSDALAIVSSVADIEEAKVSYTSSVVEAENPEEHKHNFDYSASTQAASNIIQEDEYKSAFGNTSQDLYQGLIDYFVVYEVPLGLLNKLLELRNYRLNFMIDDSGSMNCNSDAMKSEATSYMPCHGQQGVMTRIEEEENRLHIFIDILSFIPTKGMNFFFMNCPDLDFILIQHGKGPDEFKSEAHAKIRETFVKIRYGVTPTYKILDKSFKDAGSNSGFPTAHFLLTDGVPSDRSSSEVGNLIKNRQFPQQNPLTLISCTNVDSECEWMKDIEGVAPFCSECDDFNDEKAEVLKDQGKAFPYTRGFWLLSGLIGAMNPDDLDALDENVPLTKFTLDTLLGREHSASEFRYYWDNNPHSKRYSHLFERFLIEKNPSLSIVPRSERRVAQNGDPCCIIM